MKELIQQYIAETAALISKQAAQIGQLEEQLEKATASRELDKQASENKLCGLINCLDNGQYTQESITKALLNEDTSCLVEKVAATVEDDWGDLDEGAYLSSNIRPSEQKLYSKLGLV